MSLYAKLPYHGAVDLVLLYSDGGELSYTGTVLLVSPTPSGGILEVVGNDLELGLAVSGLNAARLVLPSGRVVAGEVSHVNARGGRFVLMVGEWA